MTENFEIKPEIKAAFERLGSNPPTIEDMYVDRQPEAIETPKKEFVFLLEEDSETYKRVQQALIDMQKGGYQFSASYNVLLDILDKIENGELSGEAAATAFIHAASAAHHEMSTTKPPLYKEKPVFKTARRSFLPDIPGFLKAILGKKSQA
ncbi:MAG: hypothetical protein QG639_292 [Patescibacteria group bacterium]|nr:hypothetical protein [Patescibacteria group bacterium]